MEELVCVCLDSGVDGLPVEDEPVAETQGGHDITVRPLQVGEDLLHFVGDVLVVLDFLCLD